MNNKILIVGMGYVGLTLAAGIIKKTKLHIYGYDKNKKVISNLKKGSSHIFEPNLEKIIIEAIKLKKITFSTKLKKSLTFQTIIICVGTPINPGNKKVINQSIISSCNEIKHLLKNDCLVILRSTVKIGTTKNIVKKILDRQQISYRLAYCPERTLEGNAIFELSNLPQIISTEDDPSLNRATAFFKLFNKNIVSVDRYEKGEFIKLIDNSYRDTFFSMSNQIGLISKELGFSSNEIIEKANYKFKRTNLAKTGPVGGPCLSKDPYILDQSYNKKLNSIFLAGRKVNETFIQNACIEIENLIKSHPNKKKINVIIFGIAFKCYPLTNDIRYSAATEVIRRINKKFKNSKIKIFDSFVSREQIDSLGCQKINNLNDAKNADILILHSYILKKDRTTLKNFLTNANQKLIIYSFWYFQELNKIIKKKQKLFTLAN